MADQSNTSKILVIDGIETSSLPFAIEEAAPDNGALVPFESDASVPAVTTNVPALVGSDDAVVEVDFFGAKGRIIDGEWAIYPSLGNIWCQVAPDSMMPKIRECIEQDVVAGYSDQIAQVHVGPRQGVVLFLEGKLTLAHLQGATQTDAFIEIPGVSIDDRVLTVRILAEPKYNVATADSDGNIIGDVPAIEDQTGSVRMLPEPNDKETI